MQSIVKPMPEWDGYYPKKIWKYLDEQIKYLTVEFNGEQALYSPFDENNEGCDLKFKPGSKSKFINAFDQFLKKRRYIFRDAKNIIKTDCPDCQQYGIVLSRYPMEGPLTNQASTISIFGSKEEEYEDNKPVETTTGEDGFEYVLINGEKFLYHEVIWALYHEKQPSGTIIHKDGNKKNNSIANLEEIQPNGQ